MGFIKYVPNILSVIRLAIAFAFPFSPQAIWLWLIVGGGVSDFLDGWIARRFNAKSWEGSMLDAVADKLFVLIVLLTFSSYDTFSPWWIPALISRDITVACTAFYAVVIGSWESFRRMKVRWSGKIATGVQFFFLVSVVLLPTKISFFLPLAVITSLVSAGDYGLLFIKALQDRARRNL